MGGWGGWGRGDQRLGRWGCKPQTNYTPTLDTAGCTTGRNILFGGERRAEEEEEEKEVVNAAAPAPEPPYFPSLRSEVRLELFGLTSCLGFSLAFS